MVNLTLAATTMKVHPGWKQALRLFHDEQRQPGDILKKSWLYAAFAIDEPTGETPRAISSKAELAFLGQFKRFETELLEEHQTALRVVRGVGYEIVHPRDQTAFGYERGMNDMKRGLRKAVHTVANVNLAALTVDERRHNADHLAKLASLRGMIKSATIQERVTDALGHSTGV